MSKVPSQLTPYARPDDDESTTAARGLESHFLKQLMAEVQNSADGGMLDGGFAGSTFREMLNGALADNMAKAGGIGLTAMLTKEMARSAGHSGDSKSSAPTAAHAQDAAHAIQQLRAFPGAQSTSLADVDAASPASAPTLASPLNQSTVVTSRFGARVDPLQGDPRVHAGVDLRAATGTPALAAQSGTVTRAETAGNYGNLVVVDHGNGLTTRYGHLSRIDVKPGDHVGAGQPVGEVGATGRTTGPHLHFEVRQDGHAIDPTTALKIPSARSK
jgi:murein DD-endopeptidase MepM/ murein hydrolase activator NlpD